MSPAEKIKTIKVVASKLAEIDDWREIDLTLRVFGFPWSDQWNSDDKYGYLVDHLENGTSEQLLSIKDYALGSPSSPDEEPTDIKEITGPWTPQRFRLFMSHISADKKLMAKIKTELAEYGIDGFVAHQDIEPTKEWLDEIIKALDTCDALAAFISPKYGESKWTDQEVGYCIRRRVLIIPVSLGKNPYGFMGRYQAVKCESKSPSEVAEALFRALASNTRTKTRLFEGLMGSFEESTSWATAASRARLLRNNIDTWSPELLRRLQAAKENNSQISGSFAAAPVVDRILSTNTF